MQMVSGMGGGSPGLNAKYGSLAAYFYAPHPTPGKVCGVGSVHVCMRLRLACAVPSCSESL